MMRSTSQPSPDGINGIGRSAESFDDGLVHNHHWAATSNEEHPVHGQDSVMEYYRKRIYTGAKASPSQSRPNT